MTLQIADVDEFSVPQPFPIPVDPTSFSVIVNGASSYGGTYICVILSYPASGGAESVSVGSVQPNGQSTRTIPCMYPDSLPTFFGIYACFASDAQGHTQSGQSNAVPLTLESSMTRRKRESTPHAPREESPHTPSA
jgi:hypothetical protein